MQQPRGNNGETNEQITSASTKLQDGEDSAKDGDSRFDYLITIKESQDKGLADMETGSEVYMSELLVSH